MRKLTNNTSSTAAPSQIAAAAALGVKELPDSDSSAVVARINEQLGDKALREQARWFVLSVFRHLSQKPWTEQEYSEISPDQQYALADQCLAQREFLQSLKIVLKDDRCKYALVDFARARNTAKGVLSQATVAYQHAAQHIRAAQVEHGSDVAQATSVQPTTSSLRRAQRRGFASEPVVGDNHIQAPVREGSTSTAEPQLSPQEVEELEQLLSQPQPDSSYPRNLHLVWKAFGSDESRSWLLGLSLGLTLFVLYLLLGSRI